MSSQRRATPPTSLELDILVALGDGPLHGYGIVRDIEDRGKAGSDLRSGTLYLALRRLSEAGWVEPSDPPPNEENTDARRKYFALTGEGRRVVAVELGRLRDLVDLGRRRHLLDAGGGR